MPSIADLLAGPWAILPDRLPFIRAALACSADRGYVTADATPQVRTHAAANTAHRHQAGNGAIAVLSFCARR